MSQQPLKIFVYYFIQNDSFDGLTEPNIYALPGKFTNINQIKAEHVYSSFPLKFENYYLRFFLEDKIQNMKVWMDFPPDAKIPIYGDKTYVKVLRLPKSVKLNFKNTELFSENTNVKKPQPKDQSKDNLLGLDLNGTFPQNENQKESGSTSNPGSKFNSTSSKGMNLNVDLLNSKENIPSKNKSSNNLNILNVESSNISNPSFTKQKINNDFGLDGIDLSEIGKKLQDNNIDSQNSGFEFVSTSNDNEVKFKSNTKVPSYQNGLYEAFNDNSGFIPINEKIQKEQPSNNLNSSQKNSNKNSNNTGKPTGPLSELDGLDWTSPDDNKNSSNSSNQQSNTFSFSSAIGSSSNYPIDNIPTSLNEDLLKEKVDEVIKKWTFGVNEKKNLRYILGTFYEVWTHEPMWKEISMQGLIENPSLVKSYYKKALGQTHPDKNRTKDFKTQYVADVLYNILTQANVELPK